MDIIAPDRPSRQDDGVEMIDVRAAWAKHARDLASWAFRYLVNRGDAYGRYIAVEDRRDPDLTAFTEKAKLTLAILQRHFEGKSTGDLIGLHATFRDEPCVEGGVPRFLVAMARTGYRPPRRQG
jgi:hypothetical protein